MIKMPGNYLYYRVLQGVVKYFVERLNRKYFLSFWFQLIEESFFLMYMNKTMETNRIAWACADEQFWYRNVWNGIHS